MKSLVVLVCLLAVVTAIGLGGSASSDARPEARAAGEDSPWPRTNRLRPNVRVLRRELARLQRQVELMEQSAEAYEDWQTCLRYVPVNEQGDRDRTTGYLYDERDGTGPGFMDGLAVDRRRRRGREDYMFINFRDSGCRSESPRPGGTAEPASASGYRRGSPRRPGLKKQMRRLERKAGRLFARSQRLETISERFATTSRRTPRVRPAGIAPSCTNRPIACEPRPAPGRLCRNSGSPTYAKSCLATIGFSMKWPRVLVM